MPEMIEPERYELFEPPAYTFTPTRREFMEVLGAGLLVTVMEGSADAATIGARLHVGDDGIYTVLTGKVEVGQGARVEIAMAAAEELGVPLDRVRVLMADTSMVPNDVITAGSRTTPSTIPAVRKAAAAAKSNAAVKAIAEWKTLGTSHYRGDAREMVTGAHRFPSDIQRPGMLYGCVLRPPGYGAALESADLDAARKMPGVVAIHDGPFVGCAAATSYAAREAMKAVTAKWETKPHVPSSGLYEHLKATARPPRTNRKGEIEAALAACNKRVTATYKVPYIQHAPMEPRAAVAEWADGKLTVWTGTQNPFGVRDQLAKAFRVDADKVRVVVPDSGGGFGGKHTGEVAIEVARLAREADKPVSLRWTRSEEFAWAYFRPAGLFEVEAGLDTSGKLAAWDFANYNAGSAAIESPYRTAASRTRFFQCDSPLREGSYRGIAATANTFARECFIDELAAAAGQDPLEFRLANLANPRLRAVLEAAAKSFGWTNRRNKGIACGTEKGSYVAACVEVEAAQPGAPIKIRDFHMAFECGAILNPANLRAQVEGSIIQGLGGALTEEIRWSNGKLDNGSFARYRVPRFRDVPPIQIVLVNRLDLDPAGAGETPIIAVAPAIANAVFNATGRRSRALPV